MNGTQVCSGVDYSSGWTGEIALTRWRRDHRRCTRPRRAGKTRHGGHVSGDRPGRQDRALHGRPALHARPARRRCLANRSRHDRAVRSRPGERPRVASRRYDGRRLGHRWSAEIESLVPRDVQAEQPIKATHRKIGPRDVYLVMGAPKNSTVEFRAKGQVELWDPWTGAIQPLRVLGETATGTEVELPLEDYEAQIVVFTPAASLDLPINVSKRGVADPAPAANVDRKSPWTASGSSS